ncbi:MAG: thioredoxin-like domain-containing protein, partial [Chthoniobacterales bacterium]
MKSNSLRGLLGVALLSLAADAVQGQEIADELKGKLVALRGKSLLPADPPDLPQAKYIALYFSAGWCGPCHQFTPDLVKFYQEMKPKYPGFEIVFMSEDQSSNAMEKYMGEMSMPWPALRYSFAKNDRKLTKYAGPGIPCLVLLDEKGTVISDSYAGSNYLGPHKVMNDLKKLLS